MVCVRRRHKSQCAYSAQHTNAFCCENNCQSPCSRQSLLRHFIKSTTFRSCVLFFSFEMRIHVSIGPHQCLRCVCVRIYLLRLSRISSVSRGIRSIILYFYAISSHTTVTSPILPIDCGVHRNRIRHEMKSNLLLSSETCNQITTKLHDKL